MFLIVISISQAQEQELFAGITSVPETTITYVQFTPNESVYLTNISVYQGTIDDDCSGYYMRINDGSNNEIYRSNGETCYIGHYPGTHNFYPNRQLTFEFDNVNVTQGVTYRIALYNGSSTQRGYSTSGANPLTPSGWNLRSNLNKDAFAYFFGIEDLPQPQVHLLEINITNLVNNSYHNEDTLDVNYTAWFNNTDDFFTCDLLVNDLTNQSVYVNLTIPQNFTYNTTEINATYSFQVKCNSTITNYTGKYFININTTTPIPENISDIIVLSETLDEGLTKLSGVFLDIGIIVLIVVFLVIGVMTGEYFVWFVSSGLSLLLSMRYFILEGSGDEVLSITFILLSIGIFALALFLRLEQKNKRGVVEKDFYDRY